MIEADDVDDIPVSMREKIVKIVERCRARQLEQGKPGFFLCCVRDEVMGELNHVLQLNVLKSRYGNVLHIVDIGTGIQNSAFMRKMDPDTAW